MATYPWLRDPQEALAGEGGRGGIRHSSMGQIQSMDTSDIDSMESTLNEAEEGFSC